MGTHQARVLRRFVLDCLTGEAPRPAAPRRRTSPVEQQARRHRREPAVRGLSGDYASARTPLTAAFARCTLLEGGPVAARHPSTARIFARPAVSPFTPSHGHPLLSRPPTQEFRVSYERQSPCALP